MDPVTIDEIMTRLKVSRYVARQLARKLGCIVIAGGEQRQRIAVPREVFDRFIQGKPVRKK